MNTSEIKKGFGFWRDHKDTTIGTMIGLLVLLFFWICLKYA
jgi:hypothetical protein